MNTYDTNAGSAVGALVRAATPILRINGLGRSRWQREMKAGDPRIGPWQASIHDVLDAQTWHRDGECLYFLTDSKGQIRYVGESKNRLRDRWRTPPAICTSTGQELGNPYVFHNRAWPSLEKALLANPALAPFTVSVLHRQELGQAISFRAQLNMLNSKVSATHHLAKVVQDWICAQPEIQEHIWNVAGTAKARRKSEA